MKGAAVKSRILFAALLAAGLAFIPSAAHAKGATEASVKGPGLATAIRLDMTDGPGPSVHTLAESSGLYETMYAETPNLTPPTADLGPRYEATYTVLADSVVRQHLYPFARGGAAAYVPPGQPLEGGQSTRGGWFRGPQTEGLKPLLISLGMPATPTPTRPAPVTKTGDALPVGPLAAVGGALLLLVVMAEIRRRRGRVRQFATSP
jgi:hypothetical protein